MPKIAQHQSGQVTKMLLIGDSGSGKTGALWSLAKAGYNIRLLDLDNGADILSFLTRAEPAVGENIIFETITEKMKTIQGRPVIDGLPKQFANAMNLLDHWKVPDTKDADGNVIPGYDLGKVSSWGNRDILVIDSLTMLSRAAMHHVLSVNNRLNQTPHQSDWGQAMELIESVLAVLYSKSIGCNVIVISHITFIGGGEGDTEPARGFPNTLGQKLPPKVGSYFNSVVIAKAKGYGANQKRILLTVPDGTVGAKTPSFTKMPKELPIETGLAEFFRITRLPAEAPASSPATAPKSAS